jgi:hypothetical protein
MWRMHSCETHLVLWGGTPVPRPTPSLASSDLAEHASSRARVPGAARGSRPTKIVRIWENYVPFRTRACATIRQRISESLPPAQMAGVEDEFERARR